MDEQKLVIADIKNINACNDLIKRRKWQWLFMGSDSCLREKIIGQLGSESRYYYAEEFQNICIEQKKPFLDWIAELGKQQDKTFWWATEIAYKNPHNPGLFMNYCYLTLIKRWIKQNVVNRVVIVENPWLLKACLANFDSKFVNIIASTNYFVTSWIKHNVISYGRLFFFWLRSFRMWIVNKAYALRYNRQVTSILKSKIDVLICTWVEDRSFKGKNYKFSDPYLGILYAHYKKTGFNVATITLPILPINILKKAYKCGEIIPSIYFTKLSDIFRSFFKAIRLKWNKKYSDCNGLDLASIFEYERIAEKGKVCYGFLYHRTFLNLFKINNMPLLALFYPFENQRWEKMMVLAKKAAKVNWKMIGCHNISIPPFYLNFFLGEGENKSCPQPDIVAANGAHWESVLKNAGFSCILKNGGSLRFGVKLKARKTRTLLDVNSRDNNILVLLSTNLYYSLDLLFYLIRTSNDDKKFFIKPHPDTPEKVIRRYIKEFPDNFTFVGGSMDDWMGQVGWAIHVGTTAAIECMLQGIFVFKYLPERIDLDPLLGMDIKQKVLTDKDHLNFQDKAIFDVPDNALIAEPFNEKMWSGILEQA